MKQSFPGYYRPTDEEFSQLWDDCIFTLDTNVLLHLYRYTPDTREDLLNILEYLADHDRLWISHQAALEYQENRLETIAKQKCEYDATRKIVERHKDQIRGYFQSLRHPFIADAIEDDIQVITKTLEKICLRLDQLEQEHPDLLTEDVIRDRLTDILEGRVGPKFDSNHLEQIYKQGERRYQHLIPPGYSDIAKTSEEKYGDLVIWMQITAFAQETQKPIVFVTDDSKEDWWLIFQGKTIGPRPELIQEMAQEAGVQFYMYQADQFMEHARERLNLHVTPESIDEARVIVEQEATRQDKMYQQLDTTSVNEAFVKLRGVTLGELLMKMDIATVIDTIVSSEMAKMFEPISIEEAIERLLGTTAILEQANTATSQEMAKMLESISSREYLERQDATTTRLNDSAKNPDIVE